MDHFTVGRFCLSLLLLSVPLLAQGSRDGAKGSRDGASRQAAQGQSEEKKPASVGWGISFDSYPIGDIEHRLSQLVENSRALGPDFEADVVHAVQIRVLASLVELVSTRANVQQKLDDLKAQAERAAKKDKSSAAYRTLEQRVKYAEDRLRKLSQLYLGSLGPFADDRTHINWLLFNESGRWSLTNEEVTDKSLAVAVAGLFADVEYYVAAHGGGKPPRFGPTVWMQLAGTFENAAKACSSRLTRREDPKGDPALASREREFLSKMRDALLRAEEAAKAQNAKGIEEAVAPLRERLLKGLFDGVPSAQATSK